MADNPKSTASLAGHPIHPMLIPFPIAFFVGTFVVDLVYWRTGNPDWAHASVWLLGAGIVMAGLAAIVGFTDYFGDSRISSLGDAQHHMVGNLLVVVLAIINFLLRYDEPETAVVGTGLGLSLLVVLILLYTGWKGWEMVYRHRVGVADEDETVDRARLDDRARRPRDLHL